MFAQFHRCLGKYANKLNVLSSVTWLIDARGESPHYFKTALYLYNSLFSLSSDDISDQLSQLQIESNKPQKPGFFLSNNTDYDWRNASSHVKSTPIGVIRSAKKQDSILIEFLIIYPPHLTLFALIQINRPLKSAPINLKISTTTRFRPFHHFICT